MSAYTDSFAIRYNIPSLQQQWEVAGIKAAEDINNEPVDAPDHVNRVSWAAWYLKNSQEGSVSFAWAVAMNPAIQASVGNDPTGASVPDTDVQFVVNSALPQVIADFIANPPYPPYTKPINQ